MFHCGVGHDLIVKDKCVGRTILIVVVWCNSVNCGDNCDGSEK